MVVPEAWPWSRREHGWNETGTRENSCISLQIPKVNQGVKVPWVCPVDMDKTEMYFANIRGMFKQGNPKEGVTLRFYVAQELLWMNITTPHLPPLGFVACFVQEIVCFNAKHLTTISTDARCCRAACPAEAGCHSPAVRKFRVSSAITARLSQRLLAASQLPGAAWGSRNDPGGKLLACAGRQDRELFCPPPTALV